MFYSFYNIVLSSVVMGRSIFSTPYLSHWRDIYWAEYETRVLRDFSICRICVMGFESWPFFGRGKENWVVSEGDMAGNEDSNDGFSWEITGGGAWGGGRERE